MKSAKDGARDGLLKESPLTDERSVEATNEATTSPQHETRNGDGRRDEQQLGDGILKKDQPTNGETDLTTDGAHIHTASGPGIATERPMTNQASKLDMVDSTEKEGCDEDKPGGDGKKSSNPMMKKNDHSTVALIPPVQQERNDVMGSMQQDDFQSAGPIALPPVAVPRNPSVVLLEAELVTQPIEAYHVSIDEVHIRPPEAVSLRVPFDIEDHSWHDIEGKQSLWHSISSRRYSLGFSITMGLVIVGVICVIAVPIVLMKEGQEKEETVQGMGAAEPTQSPTHPYPCYTSTVDILRAQMLDKQLPEAFIVCPNTVIEVGRLKDPAFNDFSFVDGDYPLIPIRENVKIMCGIDGRRENRCILDGGFLQVVTLQQYPSPDDGSWQYIENPVHNFTVCGFTFTGRIVDQAPFGGTSVILSHPAENVRFQDCQWVGISGTQELIGIYRNYFQLLLDLPLEGRSIDATFSDCLFDDIVFDIPIIYVWNQSITIERTIFRDISPSPLRELCQFQTGYQPGTFIEFTERAEVCSSLLVCGSGASCIMNDICVYDFANETPMIVSVINSTDGFQFDRLFADNSQSETCDLMTVTVEGDKFQTSNNCTAIFTQETCLVL
jgi:hypothetical protein